MAIKKFSNSELGNVSGGIKFSAPRVEGYIGDDSSGLYLGNREVVDVTLENAADVNNFCDYLTSHYSSVDPTRQAEIKGVWDDYREYWLDELNDLGEIEPYTVNAKHVAGFQNFLNN